MLHIHSGDAAAAQARAGGVPGEHIVWCDTLYDGPVLAGLSDDDWRATRARILSRQSANFKLADMYVRLMRQDEAVNRYRQHDEVVLWVDACLFDQLLLIRHLNWFANRDLGDTTLSLISVGEFAGVDRFTGLGDLTAEQLASLFPTRHAVTPEETALAKAAWQVFTAPDPHRVEEFIAGDTAALPYLAAAFRRHLQQFPTVFNGLSRLECECLQVVADGLAKPDEIFHAVSAMEERPFFGDTMLWLTLEALGRARTPALNIDGPERLPRFDEPSPDLNQWTITLAEHGAELLAGREDWPALNRVDRWLGGVHLYANKIAYRWDEARGCIVEASVEAGK